MATRSTVEDDVIGIDDSDGEDRPRGCAWDESVCTTTPEYHIGRGSHVGEDDEPLEPEVQVYCGRHYALELARLTEVHLHDCAAPASHHVSHYGRVA